MAFIEGNVVRIYMKDFLTFDEMEVLPKPNLNVIIGPNGTGKSTIMCGLALALSSKPVLTGRGKEICEYVKHGKESAAVEVEIYRGQNRKGNLVVRREFNKANESQFFLQRQRVTFKEVESNLKKLRIQIENLCQFLPQDRVVEFAKMNSVQLLEATERIVGEQDLHEQHKKVCNRGSEVQQLRQRLHQIQEQYQTEVEKNKRVEAEVHNHKVKNNLEVDIKEFKTRRLWFLYNQQRMDHLKLKKQKDVLVAELNSLRERWQPEMDQITDFKNASEDVQKKIKVEERVASNIASEWSGLENRWCEFEEQRQDAVCDYENKEKMHLQQQQQLQDLNKQLAAIEAEIDLYNEQENNENIDEETLTRTINELTGQVQSMSNRQAAVQQQLHQVRHQRSNKLGDARALKERIEALEDVSRRRLQLLQPRNKDAYNAAIWLQQNAHRFKDTVYPPIFTLLNVHNPAHAQYVEDKLPRQDLIAFVCRDRDDVNLLKQLMDEKQWPINIVHSGSDDLSVFRPNKPEDYIKKLGFDTYLLQAVDGPPAVLHYLCKTYNLHNIPLAVKNSVNPKRVLDDFMTFYIAESRYQQNRSRYTSDVMTNLSGVKQPHLLTQNLQHDRLASLNQQLQQLQQEISSHEDRVRQLQTEETQLSRSIEESRKRKQQLLQQRNIRKTLLARRDQKQEQIERSQKDRVNLDDALKHKLNTMQTATRNAVNVIKGWGDLTQRQTNAKLNLAELKSRYKCLNDTITEFTNMLQEMEEAVARKKQEVNEATLRVKESIKAGQETLSELLMTLGLKSASDINDELRSKFARGLQGLEATEQKLNELEAHRDCLVTADAQVVDEFNRRKKHIENLALQLEKLQSEEERGSTDVSELRTEWLNSVSALTSTINASFSKLMARMKCAGEVKLSKPSNEDDLSKYGLSICVRFRGSEKLRELTAQQQSGGERAVSTALYLLSLQTLSTVPFRCADEINQGMDSENERQMFTMLVEHMTDVNASQYFLITPKLLPNLPYNDRVNFICVFNGPKVTCQISIKNAINKKKKLAKIK